MYEKLNDLWCEKSEIPVVKKYMELKGIQYDQFGLIDSLYDKMDYFFIPVTKIWETGTAFDRRIVYSFYSEPRITAEKKKRFKTFLREEKLKRILNEKEKN